jgi:hypothetical protein
MSIKRTARLAALAGAAAALIAGALALWLSAAPPSGAASADQPQGATVTVADKTISWGSAADCVQDMGTADFGSALAGSLGLQSSPFNGCVTSNASGWGVSASATGLARDDGAYTIPPGLLQLSTSSFTGSASGATGGCEFSSCPLNSVVTVLSGAAAGTGGFGYRYALSVPDNAPAGVYNGTVTFTASN